MTRDNIVGTLQGDSRLSGGLSVGGGTTNYNDLENKPTYNGHVIEGDLTNESLGIWQPKNFSTDEQKTGVKWIDGKDIYVKVLKTYDIYQSQNALFNVGDINILKIDGNVNIGTALLPPAYFSVGIPNQFINTFYDITSHVLCCANFGWTINDYNIIIFYTKN